MRIRNTETPTFAGAGGRTPSVVETLDVVDRNGVVVATFTKSVSGAITLDVLGSIANSSGTLANIPTPATHIEDPTGAATDTDAEARTAIGLILDALEAAGIVAGAE